MRIAFLFLLFIISTFAENKPKEYEGFKLVWADEFEKDGGLNEKEWGSEVGFKRNFEMQWYQKENAYCKDGKLIIEGRKEKKPNPTSKANGDWRQNRKFINYTSACVFTKKSWQYGRFEVRAKIKTETGLWPAIWTLGVEGEWPSNGEVDLMEYYDHSILANTVFGTSNRWQGNWKTVKKKMEFFKDEKFDEKFHVWRMDWDVNSIKIYLDGKLLNETDLSRTLNRTSRGPVNPFRQPHYLLLNLAFGGKSGGSLDKTTFPSKYEIDYVRIYQSTKPQPEKKVYARNPQESTKNYLAHVKKIDFGTTTVKGIKPFYESKDFFNKKIGWNKDSDSQLYAWKMKGTNKESASIHKVANTKVEGLNAHQFILHSSWSRFILEMKNSVDLSEYKLLKFSAKSNDAANWEDFAFVAEDEKGSELEILLDEIGFKADGKWHECTIQIQALKAAGIDVSRLKKLLQISWQGGVKVGHSFYLDNVHLVK